jgi:acetyl-CoA acetyltransferases
MNREVVIVSGARTPIARSPKGALREVRPDDLAAIAIRAALERAPGVADGDVEDVILGCASPEREQGFNVARVAALRAGLPAGVPGLTLNRFCASGLEAIATAAAKIATGQVEVVVAGGTESMTLVPFMDPETFRPNPWLQENRPDTFLSMGLSVEQLARKFDVSREASDALALESHARAIAAQDAGRFDEEIVPVPLPDGTLFVKDEGPRRETSAEALAGLRLAFREDGVITAGNASPRSDGAAAVLLMTREQAEKRGLRPLARFAGYATAAVAPEDFGVAPAYALPRLLERHGLTLGDIGLIEFNEAFAAQVLAANRVYPLPLDRVNVNGGAVALGHPLGATGARQAVTLMYEARRRPEVRRGVVTMCAALGMGAAGLFDFS